MNSPEFTIERILYTAVMEWTTIFFTISTWFWSKKKIHSMRNRLFIFRLHDNFNWIYFTWRSVFYMYNVLYIYIRLCDSNQSLMLVYDHDDVACIYAETAWSICASINYILVLAETLYYIVPKKKPAKPFEKG